MKLLRRPEAMVSKNVVLTERSSKEQLCIGSKGGRDKARRTRGRSHRGPNLRVGGRCRKKDFVNRHKKREVETVSPFSNPRWMAAMADLYPLIVDKERPSSKSKTRKSEILPRGAELGLMPCVSHHLMYRSSLVS